MSCRTSLQHDYLRILSNSHRSYFFIPPETNAPLLCRYTFTNLSNQPLNLDFIPVIEYTHPDALKQFTNADWIPQTMQSKIAHEENGLKTIIQYPFMFQKIRLNYFTSNHPVASFETDRRIFLGDNEYGSFKNPLSLQQENLANTEAQRGDNICALLHQLGTLAPGATKEVITQLGQVQSIENSLELIRKYRDPQIFTKTFAQNKIYWQKYLNNLQIKTPDANMNSMLNVHNPRQCFITKNWSRYLSLYQLGLGARGIGFRDSSQDVMGVMGHMPHEAKELIQKLLMVQKQNGSAMHQFNPITMIANEGDSREEEDRPNYYGDDHLWIILATIAYLKETGNLKFLEEIIPYYEKDKNEQPLEKATVFNHLQRALEFTHANCGNHGLPLLGFADWNDTVNLPKGAESVFNANLYGKALLEMIDLCKFLKNETLINKYENYYQKMQTTLRQVAWDGNWFIRYFDHQGQPLGSKKNSEGAIYTNAQAWSVISGFATHQQACAALEAVYQQLNTKNGIKLSTPGYNGFDPIKGGVTTYPPGAKENGGIFLHANPWVMIAETIVGNGDRAFQYYDQINPAAKNEKIDKFECAPYNYPQNILGDEHDLFGLARNSWLSGTSSWTYQAATKYILGIRAEFTGLKIDPCIPKNWPGFEVHKIFRGALYKIVVTNPHQVSKGVKNLKVDGKTIKGNIVPIFEDQNEHQIEIILG
ncbi:MAG: carbohydrate binding protein [Candidatus Magnetoglobus multicellularis str. Araruama]|uniref:Carbohydrate binding protein n=1 Tax=Candidatus Magnetoglobus multicellularis str. Araruama TaxID=890399 RepID=A0A1V1P396_9BACT|nr:MAG: carbohydrate binding protein [Candidatus Magnetoglobus multicellularis str. Araruama]